VEDIFGDLARSGRTPGPKNLVDPIVEFVCGSRQAKRNQITRYLSAAWEAAGGQPIPFGKWEPRIKKALVKAKAKAEGKLREFMANGVPVHGVWECVASSAPASIPEQSADVPRDQPVVAEIDVGAGPHLVYGVYFAEQRAAAEARGEQHWPIKVGKTTKGTPLARMGGLTFHPDRLVWGIAIRTDRQDQLESAIQTFLDLRGRRYHGDGGREWFVTSLEEIREIYLASVAPP